MITNLYLCEPNYVIPVFNKIKNETENDSFLNFLSYFEETYIKKYGYKNWNYYNNVTHATNNSCEAYNNKLNGLFKVKPIFFKLVYELRLEKSNIVNTFNKRNCGLLGAEIRRNLKIVNLINIMNSKSEEIERMPKNTQSEKKLVEDAWFNYIKELGT